MSDFYCEHSQGGIAQPLNVISNAGFFIAAALATRLLVRNKPVAWEMPLLVLILVAIGIGSSLYHLAGTAMMMWADVIPILLFQLLYIPSYGARAMRLSPAKTSVLVAGFVALMVVAESMPAAWLNGSVGYLPALLFLSGFGLWHCKNKLPQRKALIIAAALFTLSLILRTADRALCDAWPYGVHFLWHLFNAGVLYLALVALIAARRGAKPLKPLPRRW